MHGTDLCPAELSFQVKNLLTQWYVFFTACVHRLRW